MYCPHKVSSSLCPDDVVAQRCFTPTMLAGVQAFHRRCCCSTKLLTQTMLSSSLPRPSPIDARAHAGRLGHQLAPRPGAPHRMTVTTVLLAHI